MQTSANDYIALWRFNATWYWPCNAPAAAPVMLTRLVKSSKIFKPVSFCPLYLILMTPGRPYFLRSGGGGTGKTLEKYPPSQIHLWFWSREFEDPRYSKVYVDLVHESTITSVFTQHCVSWANLSIRHITGGPWMVLRVLINYKALYHK